MNSATKRRSDGATKGGESARPARAEKSILCSPALRGCATPRFPSSLRRFVASSLVLVATLASTARAQSQSIVNTLHNLSAGGNVTGRTVYAASEQQICIFCHTPHNASGIQQPLWNRSATAAPYTPYRSNSLQALPGQPTGTSKLCLSCHDGTIALGAVLSRNQPIAMAGGFTTLPPGKSNLGTDLSDDHPISFVYDATLAGKSPHVKDPTLLNPATRLDSNHELQCTSCHNAHDNTNGKFLVMDNANSQLCNSCHQQGVTTITEHLQCGGCHQSHSAPSGPYLLVGKNIKQACTSCHNSTPSPTKGKDILTDLSKTSSHDTDSPVNLKNHVPDNLDCADCHEPHTMTATTAVAPLISGKLGRISGINSAGAPVLQAQYGYEVCYKCHADTPASKVTLMSRQVQQVNTRLQFATSAVSFHPVEGAGRNMNVPSLRPGLNTGSVIACTSCHGSDTSVAAGGSGPNGPHGSNDRPLLVAQYLTADNTPESASAYALCYSCHQRTSILANESFPEHSLHVVTASAPCSACHDSHGISSGQGTSTTNSNLINFDKAIVQPLSGTPTLAYTTPGEGAGQGSCTLTCHGVDHFGFSYNRTASPLMAKKPLQRVRPVAPPVKKRH